MSQVDYSIANASGATVRADINTTLAAIATNNSGASAPATTFADMWWYDTSSNLLKIRDDANASWLNPLVGQHTMWLPASAWVSRTTDGAAIGSFETGTNKHMIETFDFDTAADEFIQTANGILMPKGWNEGTMICKAVWSHPSTTVNFGVAWFIQAVALANSDALDTAFGTAVSMVDTGGTTDDEFITDESGAMTVAGSPGAEEMVKFQLYRDVSDGGDTLAVDARFEGLRVHYTTENNVDD